jgi:hypothetical protein
MHPLEAVDANVVIAECVKGGNREDEPRQQDGGAMRSETHIAPSLSGVSFI